MDISLNDIISKSKNRIANLFFRIVKKDETYEIIQYLGPHKSLATMMSEGWNRHPYLQESIDSSYPIFDINDFKSEDGVRIVKKTPDDEMKNAFKEILEYYNMNKKLVSSFSGFKKLMQKLGIDFMKFESFDSLVATAKSTIDRLSLPQLDKAELLFEFVNLRISIFEELEKINIEHPIEFLSEKFRHFLMIV